MSDQSTLFPIRDLSELTQVNTVTLRAWERRYGLLKPARTAKGHRLYSQDDVNRVKAILDFMAKGVAVGKVKALLEQEIELSVTNTETSKTTDSQSDWHLLVDQLEKVAASFSLAKTAKAIKDLFLNYPTHLCYSEVIAPLFAKLETTPQQQAKCAILQSAIIDYCLLRLNAKTAKKPEAQVLLICAQHSPIWKLAISAIELKEANFDVSFINQPCTIETWMALAQQTTAKSCIVYSEGVWKSSEAKQILSSAEQYPHLTFCGTAAVVAGVNSKHRVSSPDKILAYLTN